MMNEAESAPRTPEHNFLEAMIEWRAKGNKTEAIKFLDQALNGHI